MAANDLVDYENLAENFSQALIHTLRKHSVADTFLDYWVPDADPVLGIVGMVDSARIAGRSEIAIRFRLDTVPEDRLPELEKAIGEYSNVNFEKSDGSVILRATGLKMGAVESKLENSNSQEARPTYWQADKASATPADELNVTGQWESQDLPEFSDVHPHFRPGIKAAFDNLSCEDDGSVKNKEHVRLEGIEGNVKLVFEVDPNTHRVSNAQHAGADKPSEIGVLDLFCRAAKGLPLQEVADHVGLKVIRSLIDEDKDAPVGGILLPVNSGAPFMFARRLARKAYDQYREENDSQEGYNFYYAPPSERWQNLSPEERFDEVLRALRAFLQSNDMLPEDLELLRLEKNKYNYQVRGVIGFSENVPAADKPSLMRKLEQKLRSSLKTEIELVADRAKDSSSLRRL